MDFHMGMDPDPTPFLCILNKTDSTSAMGWLRKIQPQPSGHPHQQKYRKVTHLQNYSTKLMQLCTTPAWGAERPG